MGCDTMDFDERASRGAEAIYLTRDMVEARRRTIEALGLAPGARVLDVGSGPGLFADEMAQVVGPTGYVRGVDLSESMIEIARARCADKPWVDFQIADAVSLPLEDGGFDACVSVQTLEFVADVDAALREMHRVLKPGGRLAVSDADWGATSWPCKDAALCERVMAGWLASPTRGCRSRSSPGSRRRASSMRPSTRFPSSTPPMGPRASAFTSSA